ncbi:alpha/beta-hydrolase [Mytilinidion resinicola]|uniref:Alpha/beta-hydrolase n=1 Tax=Mytilinidion resinicola TaxID=574789 RepID=A0A6A6Z192_9PEZI|nr:alpha/beta-hydrolase [Mytilinidion resinicola]KAF2813997.1 alpha/beta-hydrolase [Mytilinidion resinicola]
MLYILPKTIISVVLARTLKSYGVSFKDHVLRSIIRGVLFSFPRAILRAPGEAQVEKVLASPRFSAVRKNLVEPVKTSAFSGYWICQGSISAKKEPQRADVTLLFGHGGGYVLGHIAQWCCFLVYIAEIIETEGLSVSILALDYSLAPEAPFPTQMNQAHAAYSFLLDLGTPADKIALIGDSAGGSLMMSLLASLAIPLSPSTTTLPKPLGVYLLSAWLSFKHTSPTFSTNASIDVLDKRFLNNCANDLRAASSHSHKTIETYTEFVHPVPSRLPLSKILPRTVWASAGADEVFRADIEAFAKLATEAGADVTLKVAEGKAHDWEFGDVVAKEADFLKTTGDLGEDFAPGAKVLALAIVDAVKKQKSSSPRL